MLYSMRFIYSSSDLFNGNNFRLKLSENFDPIGLIQPNIAPVTGTGYWGENNEWRYYLHGVGCRLIHTITDEIVDWDASDPYRFDPYWFVEWLSWFLKQNVFFRQPTEEKAILTISSMIDEQNKDGFRKKILAVLEQLHQQGRLLCPPDYTNKYKLIV
jgi:hypothetical protein